MLRARDLLDRLRPVGTPGAAGPTGVPVDRRAGIAVELAPVFAALADIEDECARIRSAAETQAAQRRQAGMLRADDLVARAGSDAEAERAAAAAGLRRRAEAAATQLQLRAERDADAIRDRAHRQLPDAVAAVLDRVRDDIGALAGNVAAGRRS